MEWNLKKTGQGAWLNITANKAYNDLFRTMPIIPAAKQTVRYPLTVQSSRRPKQLEMSSFAKHKLSEKQKKGENGPTTQQTGLHYWQWQFEAEKNAMALPLTSTKTKQKNKHCFFSQQQTVFR